MRALTVLKTVDRILAEDTRRTATLLRRYEIATPLVSAHEHNEAARAVQLTAWLDAGEQIALVSDAGTPLLSDPGARLVRAVLDAGHDVVPIPGASAALAALVAAGLPPEPFTFFGFLPRGGKARGERLAEIGGLPHTAVVYESPARLLALLDDLATVCEAERPVVVARELTKLHETFVRGHLAEVRTVFNDQPVRGEVVVLIGGVTPAEPSAEDRLRLAESLLASGASARTVSQELARRLRIPRNEAYALVLSLTAEELRKE